MKLISLKIQNKNKFLKGVEINFEPNNKRKDNPSQIIDGLLNSVGIFGKNASGKTTIINNIITYFSLIDKKALLNDGDNMYLDVTQNINMSLNYSSKIKEQGKSKLHKIIDTQLKDNPHYTAVFKLKNGKKVKHSIRITMISDTTQAIESLEVDGEYMDITTDNPINGSKLMHNFISKRMLNLDDILLNATEVDEFVGYIRVSLENIYLTNIKWDKEIENKFKEWENNGEDDKSTILMHYIRLLDPNTKRFVRRGITEKLYIEINTVNGSKYIPIKYLSSGTRISIIYFIRILNIGVSPYGGLMIQDEIEGRVHDEIVKDMIGIIEQNDLNTQIIFTSHAPHIFDNWFRQDGIYFIQNIDNVIDLYNIADKYKERSDKLVSSIFKNQNYTSPGDY